jgi:Asp/Glu/hydantoin racemase
MKLRAVAPLVLDPDEVRRRQQRYSALAPAPLDVAMANLSTGPRTLETEADIRWSENEVYDEAMRTAWDDYDGILLDCVLDPALERLEQDAPLPVIGITRTTAAYLGGLGHRFAGVARNAAIAEEFRARIVDFGHEDRLTSVDVLDLSFEDIADPERWNAALAPIVQRFGPGAVDSVLNGCSAVEVRDAQGPAVVEPMALALELTALAARRGLTRPTGS